MLLGSHEDSAEHKIAVLNQHLVVERRWIYDEKEYMRTRLSIRNPFAMANGRRRGSMERAKGNWAMIGSYNYHIYAVARHGFRGTHLGAKGNKLRKAI